MKKIGVAVIVMLSMLITSCMSTKQIGKLNMISNRNVDSKMDYKLIKNYVGGSRKELRRYKGKSLEEAIDNVVKATPGGEFLKNVKIYIVNSKYYAVEGDIWGTPVTVSK
ncbi:MAG: hypothetical protein V4547_18035 [Bacteroidota bacterium]